MAETARITFTHQEVAEALLARQKITEGIWSIYIKFGLAAANLTSPQGEHTPSAIVPVLEIGLTRSDKETNLTVDASRILAPVASGRKSAPTGKRLRKG